MSVTIRQAIDQINSTLQQALNASSVTQNIRIDYDDRKPPTENEGNISWIRSTIIHTETGFTDASLSGDFGQRSFGRNGTIITQVFTPLNGGKDLNYDIVQIILNAFEGKRSVGQRVWFRNSRFSEKGRDRAWFRTDVRSDFVYDEVK